MESRSTSDSAKTSLPWSFSSPPDRCLLAVQLLDPAGHLLVQVGDPAEVVGPERLVVDVGVADEDGVRMVGRRGVRRRGVHRHQATPLTVEALGNTTLLHPLSCSGEDGPSDTLHSYSRGADRGARADRSDERWNPMSSDRDVDVLVIGVRGGRAVGRAGRARERAPSSVLVAESGGHHRRIVATVGRPDRWEPGRATRRRSGIEDDADSLFHDYMQLNQWKVEAAVVRRLMRAGRADGRVAGRPRRGVLRPARVRRRRARAPGALPDRAGAGRRRRAGPALP